MDSRSINWDLSRLSTGGFHPLGGVDESREEEIRVGNELTSTGEMSDARLRKRHMESASSPEPMSPSDNTETDSESQDGTAVSCAEKNLTALESAYSGEQDGPAVSYGRKPSKGRESGKDSEVYSKRMGEEITQTESSPNIKLPVQSLKMASEPKLLSKIDPEVPLETLEGPSRSRSWATLDPAEITATGPGRWGVVRTTKTQSEPTPPARVLPFEKTKLPNVNLPKHQAILDDLREQNQNSEMKGVNITDEGDGWLAKILN
ncbi:hypothetical protein EV426DRAFT_645027 [Tirmania nivea]|nr:hypothetical protein EV426DRAFT_645027 [Tirmania nivea]